MPDKDFDVKVEVYETINSESQSDQAAGAEDKAINDSEKKFLKARIESLKAQQKTQAEIDEQLAKDKAEIEKYNEEQLAKDKIKSLEQQVQYGATLQERLDAEHLLRLQKGYKALNEAFVENTIGTLSSKFDEIKKAGEEYADYVERIEVGLIGSTKSYDTVTEKLDKVFQGNVFFSLKDALDKTTEMIDSGISYNVELRASLDTMSDKIAATFNAMDTTLLRLVKIQQQDSTQARLGVESLLLTYLNTNFQNSEYLQSLSDNVSSLLLEAESQKTTQEAVEFEYAVQKWLGSYSSVGVSDNTITALAKGLGYLGSGDVSSLTSDSGLQQLMALSVQYGSGSKSYGEMLTGGLEVSDVSSILTGFYRLVKEISNSGNMVAMNQYADLFGLTMSDITSVLNLTDESISKIASDMVSYQDTINQVNNELSVSNLLSRSSASEMYKNLKSNIMSAIGLEMADSIAMNLMYEAIDTAASVVDMFDLGIEVDPFGVGTSVKIASGDLLKAGTASLTYARQYAKNISSLTSLLSPNLSLLGGEDSTQLYKNLGIGIGGTSQIKSGKVTNEATYVGRTDNSAVYETVNQEAKSSSSEIIQKDIDEEQENMEKTQKSLQEIGDNVDFIVQLLNVSGIKVRSYPTLNGNIGSTEASIKEESSVYMRGGY